jgi:DNA modification methylase
MEIVNVGRSPTMGIEFRSRLEDYMHAVELNFPSTPAFGDYKPFLDHAVAHPAKANMKLLEYLILNYTKPGDVILDPMAGSGSTGVVAALHGRNAIQIDIEEKFYKWMEMARLKVEKHPTLLPKGWIRNICGDARKLSELLSQVDICITSPPYLTDNVKLNSEEFWRKVHEVGGRWGSKPPAGTEEKQMKSEGNIANLPLGPVDAILTSPPYSNTISRNGGPVDVNNVGISTITAREYSNNKDNIGNLPLGNIDIVITSPPYADAKKGVADAERMAERWDEKFREKGENWDTWGKTWKTPGRVRGLESLGSGYSESRDNIGNLPIGDIDAVVRGLMTRDGKPTYLSEMLKVYSEMYKVLKPSGLAIVIVKPFIRNKKIVDLPYYTWLLMSKVGFKLEKLYKLRLKQQSFWRLLYHRKNPEVPVIAHEWILICRKP